MFRIKCKHDHDRPLHIIRLTAMNAIMQGQSDAVLESSNGEATKGGFGMYPGSYCIEFFM